MSAGRTHRPNCSAVRKTQLERGVFEADVLAVSEERNLRGLLVADMRIERGRQHQRIVEVLLDALGIGLDAGRATRIERADTFGPKLRGFQNVVHADDRGRLDRLDRGDEILRRRLLVGVGLL
jgi:hypothetical protein